MLALDMNPRDYLNQNFALNKLAEALYAGCLVIFVGSGVSKSASGNFPNWESLAEGCCDTMGINFDVSHTKSNNYILQRIEDVRRVCKTRGESFSDVVKANLYTNVDYNLKLMSTEILVALGALVISSVRGSAQSVINYNFDDVLVWYLESYGYKTKIFSKLPDINCKSDVTIYHPHGFLPMLLQFQEYKNENIVFSDNDYLRINSAPDNPWNQIQQTIMSNNLSLHIGLSGDDSHINTLCLNVYEKTFNSQRIVGFTVLKSTEENIKKKDPNLDRGIVSIFVEEYEDIPDLLMDICQRAAKL